MLQDRLYAKDQTIVKVYGSGADRKLKVITLNALRVKGVIDHPEFASQEEAEKYAELIAPVTPDIEAIHDFLSDRAGDGERLPSSDQESGTLEKMRESKSRARARIFELAFCNKWDWFFTGTLDSAKYDRTNLNKWHHDFTLWLRHYAANRHMPKLDFLLIPELHSDGKSWHMHGLLAGLPVDQLHQFQLGDIMGGKIAAKVRAGELVYNWIPYQKKFGFCDLEPIKDTEAVSKYCCKYITKSLQHSVKELGAHLYYHSRGLSRSEVVAIGHYGGILPAPEYANDFCSVVWLPYTQENLAMLQANLLGGVHYASRGKGFAMVVPDWAGAADPGRTFGTSVEDPLSED